MKNRLMLVAAIAASTLAGCGSSAAVQGGTGSKLTLVRPAAVTVHRGGMSKAAIKIGRTDLPGDVAIRFTNLPKGVDVVETDSRIVGDEGNYTLRAGDGADLVENHAATVTATGGPAGISVSESININVKAKE